MKPDLAGKIPIVVTNPSPSTVHAGQQLGFVCVRDECVGGPGMCNEIDLFGMVCKVGVEKSEPEAVCQRTDKLSELGVSVRLSGSRCLKHMMRLSLKRESMEKRQREA